MNEKVLEFIGCCSDYVQQVLVDKLASDHSLVDILYGKGSAVSIGVC
jgi:hypothetical protein